MKIGILQTAYKKSEDYGAFYNVQELGLARALADMGNEVILYKAVDGAGKEMIECEGKLSIRLMSVKYFGINGLIDINRLDTSIEVLIYFCDTQLKVPSVYKWCNKNNINFIPYIGVVESHSENKIKRFLMDRITTRNIKIYQRCMILAKTPAMVDVLYRLGCNNVKLFPVGLDENVMHNASCLENNMVDDELKLLFVGRMEEEKQPLQMVKLYEEILKINSKVKLIMIGDGHLYEEVSGLLDKVLEEKCLEKGQAQLIKKVPYSQMYDYYSWADLYVNLNMVEILGMSILEAMYYFCPVLAVSAPGPEFILKEEDDYCGIVAPDFEDLLEVLKFFAKGEISAEEITRITSEAGRKVRDDFVWKSLAPKLIEVIQ